MLEIPWTESRDAEAVQDTLRQAAQTLHQRSCRQGSIDVLPGHGTLLVSGDLHDNPFHFEALLRMARLEEGEDRHLILHELIHGEHLMNGMDFSYRMLLKTADLVRAHPGVHPMLANHEIAQLMKTRVTKGHGECVTLFRDALEFTFGEHHEVVEQALDEFIAAMALGVRAENGVWCSHSLPGRAVMSSFDPEIVRRPLVASDFEKPKGSAYLMTWGRVFEDVGIDLLAEAWKVQLFCLGHRKVPTGVESEGERLVLVNSDHEGARAFTLILDQSPPSPEECVLRSRPLNSV